MTTRVRRRRGAWLLAAALLLAAGALLSLGAGEPIRTRRPAPDFPTRMDEREWERYRERATWTPPAPPPAAALPASAPGPAPEPAAPRDPLHVALPVRPDEPLVVFEANALRHSRVGEAFVRCMLQKDPDAFAEVERDTGIDVLKDLDRVAFTGDALVLSGYFDGIRADQLEDEFGPARPYGAAGRLFEREDDGAEEPAPSVALWGDAIMVMGLPGAVRQALDQLEGRAPVPEGAIPEGLAYGEVYGILPGAAARRLVPGSDRALADRIAAAAQRIELHVDAMGDVAAVVRVVGDDGAGLEDLSKALAGGLAAARIEAQVTNDRELADLLEFARVTDGDGRFSVELALPADRVERWFGDCKPPGPRQATPPDSAADPAQE